MRKAMLVLVVACTTVSLAAPAAVASEPFRFHIRGVDRGPTGTFVLPADVACPFGLRVESEGTQTYWLFSDGHEALNADHIQTVTNTETGVSVVHHTTFHKVLFHHDDGSTLEIDHGSFLFIFFEGDQGPNGVVGPGGETYFMTGTAKTAFGADFVITSFSLDGQSTDVCQLLSA